MVAPLSCVFVSSANPYQGPAIVALGSGTSSAGGLCGALSNSVGEGPVTQINLKPLFWSSQPGCPANEAACHLDSSAIPVWLKNHPFPPSNIAHDPLASHSL